MERLLVALKEKPFGHIQSRKWSSCPAASDPTHKRKKHHGPQKEAQG